MHIARPGIGFGRDARDRLTDAADPGVTGARAALESFYYALNNRDSDSLAKTWSDHSLAQLNNPLGGMLRGGDAISELYQRIFTGPVGVWVRFADIVEYAGEGHVVYAGRETGEYSVDGTAAPLSIRTSRFFHYDDGRWCQYHHHGSIDDPAMLEAYQRAVSAGPSRSALEVRDGMG